MLGWLKKKPVLPLTPAELRQELFALLRDGDIEGAKASRFDGVTFENCIVGLRTATYYTEKNKIGKLRVEADELTDLSDKSLKMKSDFYDYHASFEQGRSVDMLTPTGYFASKENLPALEYVLSRKMDTQRTSDCATVESFRAPLYFALRDLAMTELLVNHGQPVTDKLVTAATLEIKGSGEDDLAVLSFLISRGGKIDVVKNTLAQCTDPATAAGILNQLKTVGATAPKPAVAVTTLPAATAAPTMIKNKRTVDDLTIVEVYDFNQRERMTILRRANGDVQSAPLRESFNALGRDCRGLQQAIEDFRAAGGVYDGTPLQSASAVRIVASPSGRV